MAWHTVLALILAVIAVVAILMREIREINEELKAERARPKPDHPQLPVE